MDWFLPNIRDNALGGLGIIVVAVVAYVLSRFFFRQKSEKNRGADSGRSLEEKVKVEAEKLTDDIVSEIMKEPHWWDGMDVPESFEGGLRIIIRHRVQRVAWKFMGLELPPVRMRSPRVVRSVEEGDQS